MAHDFRNAPDDEVIEPNHCGHVVSIGSTLFECDLTESHEMHAADRPAMARRSPLGFADVVTTRVRIEWSDPRLAATVGDMRALIRASQAGSDTDG